MSPRPSDLNLKPHTHRPLSSSFWGLPYRILNINHKKELLRGLWVDLTMMLKVGRPGPRKLGLAASELQGCVKVGNYRWGV